MIQLYIDGQLTELNDTSIMLQKEFDNSFDKIVVDAEFSYSIEIPSTLTNDKIFNFASTFDTSNKFVRIYDAELYSDDNLIIKGKFKLSEITSTSYKGNLYSPKKQSIKDILGDRNLNEIKEHLKPMNSISDAAKINTYVGKLDLNWPDVLNEYDHQEDVKDNHICFPYVLYGLPYKGEDSNDDIYRQSSKVQLTMDDVFPAYQVTSVIKDIFKTEGYNVIGNVFNNNYFNDLYQTFQAPLQDYVDTRQAPYYCKFDYNYTNTNDTTYIHLQSDTLEQFLLWDEPEFVGNGGDNPKNDGLMKYFVDSPNLEQGIGEVNTQYGMDKDSIVDENLMLKVTNLNGHLVTIPKSGWWRIHVTGNMSYRAPKNEWYSKVGKYVDERDNTTLAEQPFEFQIKKGTPKENPQLYSFNTNPNTFDQDLNVLFRCDDTLVRYVESEAYYGKNEKVSYTFIDDENFIACARLGGAWFGTKWRQRTEGDFQRPYRYRQKGALLALPMPVNQQIENVTSVLSGCQYRKGETINLRGLNYFKVADSANTNYEYADRTAQVFVKKNRCYTNFDGYNKLNPDGSWDTTSNFQAVKYDGLEDCRAISLSDTNGSWIIDTVVWLEEGDTIYEEILTPTHIGGYLRGGSIGDHSSWRYDGTWTNITDVDYEMEFGYISSNEDWRPNSDSPVTDWSTIKTPKYTNVNQFLPKVKASDYLNAFLTTFNLQLSTVDATTFEINSSNENFRTNIINIDNLANANDVIFKSKSSDTNAITLAWKNDLSETGYLDGNQSPYKAQDPQYKTPSGTMSTELIPWFSSGYTGSYTFPHDLQSTTKIEKKENIWSYAWYKSIYFDNENAVKSVIVESSPDLWKANMTYADAEGERPQTSKTSRLFFLKRTDAYAECVALKQYGSTNYINLLLPTNYKETINFDKTSGTRQELDFTEQPKTTDSFTQTSLVDKFFNYNTIDGQYEIDVPIKLDNYKYNAIKPSTLIEFNNSLFKVQKIEGHDVSGNENATLTLLSL